MGAGAPQIEREVTPSRHRNALDLDFPDRIGEAAEGDLNCALQFYEGLKDSSLHQGCGITREGLACDWHGLLYPCHRAMEIGTEFAIGSIFDGVDAALSSKIRTMIHEQTFSSRSAKEFPLASYCPVAVYQKDHNFHGDWSREWSEMISLKAKLVAKHYPELVARLEAPTPSVVGLADDQRSAAQA
jgi:radical SAM protein with 4Fe4S-binding SPASM domain